MIGLTLGFLSNCVKKKGLVIYTLSFTLFHSELIIFFKTYMTPYKHIPTLRICNDSMNTQSLDMNRVSVGQKKVSAL